MADLDEVDTTQHVIHEDTERERDELFPGEDRWRVLVARNDQPSDDPDAPEVRSVWETQYYEDRADKWHVGTPSWATHLRLMPKVYQAGLVSGRAAEREACLVVSEKQPEQHRLILKGCKLLMRISEEIDNQDASELLVSMAQNFEKLMGRPGEERLDEECDPVTGPTAENPGSTGGAISPDVMEEMRRLLAVLNGDGLVDKEALRLLVLKITGGTPDDHQDVTVTPETIRITSFTKGAE